MAQTFDTSRPGTVFWRVAAVLIAVQLATGILAVAFTFWYASDHQRALAEVAIAARLDAVAEEIEGLVSTLEASQFTDVFRLDMGYRFPDPLTILDLGGTVLDVFYPAQDAFEGVLPDESVQPIIPDILDSDDVLSDVLVDASDALLEGGYAMAPLFDEGGFLAGLVLVQPLSQSMDLELMDTRAAFRRSLRTVGILAIIMALLLGAGMTWWMVRPLRSLTRSISRIGDGQYDESIQVKGNDEFSELSSAINVMAVRVARSIEALKESDRLRRDLVANVGHDLRTPLAAMLAHLEEAERFNSEGRAKEAEDAVGQAARQGSYLSALVDDLFELSRLESQGQKLRQEPVPIGELVADAIAGNQGEATKNGISLLADVADGLPLLTADGTRLLRVLNNLISNAIRYTSDQGVITVKAVSLAHQIVLSVTDTGVGISAPEQARMFDRYYRGEGARTRVSDATYKGTGLGLAISRAIAQAHKGSLEVESTPGEGTSMILTLPVR
ncbi:MAG: HAMP domain-containing sensor histidine kinase [Rhodothermales bacterium]|nr:HAMP domain-containing sensor histidine kinase [Rhodothermales bacterium]